MYFGDKWREFFTFYSSRGKPPFFDVAGEVNIGQPLGDVNLLVPQSRSNYWGSSWRRFMVDFMFGRGYYVIYPNNRTYVTPVLQHTDENIGLGLMTQALEIPSQKNLPELSQLPVFDLFCRPSSRQTLGYAGDKFLERISNLGNGYQSLLRDWFRPCIFD